MSLLTGIRVLDLSLQLPGPFCTLMMADYGADVIKVDEPYPRVRNPLSGEDPGTGPVDRYLNRGKRSLTLNLKTEEGRAIFLALAGRSDVVVEGFRPGVVKRLGVDYEPVSGRNPRIVYCSISGYGQTGPMRDAAGHDINYVSYAGILGSCGRAGDPPAIPPVQVGDLFGGALMALSGILMALLSRQATGRGRYLDVSMTDGALAMLSVHSAMALAGMEVPERGRMMLTGAFPCYDVYRCAGGEYLSLGPLEGWFWKRLLEALGRTDLEGGQYAVGGEAERVRGELSRIFGTRSRDEWVRFFEGQDVCVSPVLSLPEALDHPLARAREMVVAVDSPWGGTDRQPGLPVKVSGVDGRPGRPPRLGEHDEEILSGLGIPGEEIASLRAKGVLRGS